MPASTRRAGSVDPGTSRGSSDAPLDQATRLIEAERAQIGHEIHDGLLPLIFAASAAVSSMIEHPSGQRSAEPDPKLQQIAGWLEDALQTGRRLLTQVYPPELTGTLWTHAARDTLDRLFGDANAKIHWQIDPEINEIDPPLSLTVYRIVVEAVRNAIQHGKASEVVVVGARSSSGIRITVRDDGCGFDPRAVPQDRFGIRSMTARAKLVGGSLEIDSAPGGPTIVAVAVPQETV